MTDKEQITCKYKFQDKERFNDAPYCACFSKLCEDLPICDDNCQIYEDDKQLARKTQECEELKESNKKAQELYKYFMDVAENTANKNKELENNLHIANTNHQAAEKECDRYLEALEEIEKVINNILNSCLGRNTVSCRPAHNVCGDLIKILDIINKAKG